MIAGELTTSSRETSKCVNYVFPHCNPSGGSVSGDFSIFRGRMEAMIYRFFGLQVTVVRCCDFSSYHNPANAIRTEMETRHQHISTVHSVQAGVTVL